MSKNKKRRNYDRKAREEKHFYDCIIRDESLDEPEDEEKEDTRKRGTYCDICEKEKERLRLEGDKFICITCTMNEVRKQNMRG